MAIYILIAIMVEFPIETGDFPWLLKRLPEGNWLSLRVVHPPLRRAETNRFFVNYWDRGFCWPICWGGLRALSFSVSYCCILLWYHEYQ